MKELTKLIASTAALIAALALAWIPYHGITLRGRFGADLDLYPNRNFNIYHHSDRY
jgi:hypothetical protein